MAEHRELRDRRQALGAAEAETHALRHALGQARERRDRAERRGEDALGERIEAEIEALEARQRSLAEERAAHRAVIDRLRTAVLPDDPTSLGTLTSSIPIALLPVRVETHFERDAARVTELRIRVYPDDIHVASHEPELTEDEVVAGRAHWRRVWRAGTDQGRRSAAWRTLAEETGIERADWVRRETAPRNEPPVLSEPLEPSEPLPVEPEFPDPARKEGDWTRAPRAQPLPDRWVALGFRNKERVFVTTGARLPDDLAVGPDPAAQRADDDALFVDAPSRWTIDFDEAEALGMGIRVRAGSALSLDEGLDLLLVLGVKATAEPDEGAESLTRLFETHRYTEGLAFLRRGSPTNNTEPERSGWREAVLPASGSMPPAEHVIEPDVRSNAGRWAAALGLDAAQATRAFGAADGATRRDEDDARAMSAGLWPATWGYLLTHLANPALRPHVASLRDHAVGWVRSGGHHPSIRLGRQPYGLLVQTDLDGVVHGREDETVRRLLELLIRLRDEFWIPAIARVPRVGRTGDPERDLVEVLGQRAASPSYAIRPMVGPDLFANLWAWLGSTPATGWREAHRAVAREPLDRLSLELEAPILDLAGFTPVSEEIPHLVQQGATEPGQTLAPDYIQWLLDSGHARLLAEDFPAPPPATLLYLLLRQSALQETAREAISWLSDQRPDVATQRLEPELVDVGAAGADAPELTLARVLDLPVAGVTEGEPIGAYLSARRFSDAGRLAPFREFWVALEHLKGLPVDRLELLLRETLDLSAHRLDAWLSSFSARLLADRRGAQEHAGGVYVGGYGWVEDLRPRTAPRSDGYVHAPSSRHAGLAAVLRSAYLSHRDSDGAGAFAVDLSSERVRLASWLLDGVREGQSLGALLGYRFERALHEQHPGVELDAFIFALRRRAPLVAGKLEPTTEPLEAVAARNVVDGLALVRRWERGQLSFDADDLPAPGSAEHDAIIAELEALQALIDAVGDTLLAESVFQSGNPSRLGATLDAVASGEQAPPELEFARTPRHGLAVVHRVAVAFPANPPAPAGWAPDARQVRAFADPAVNAWVGELLGTPDRYRYVVRYVRQADGSVLHEAVRSLAGLAISPLDAVVLADGDEPDETELAARARHEAELDRPSSIPSDARIEIGDDAAQGEAPLQDLLEMARAIRQVVHRVRPLGGAELTALGESTAAGIDLVELEVRVGQLLARFTALDSALAVLLSDAAGASVDALRDALLGLHAFGLRGAVPRPATGSGDDAREPLVTQARAVAREAASRRQALEQVIAEFDVAAPDDEQRAEHARERAQALLRDPLPILPRFTAANGSELAQSLAEQIALTGGDRQAPVTWLQRNARVREPLADLHEVLLYDAALNGRDPYRLRVAQMPFRSGSIWAGLPAPLDPEEDANRLSLVLLDSAGLDPTESMAGFVVDEWPETIPVNHETTSVTLHYDQPGARAPNALVLAVSPRQDAPWDLDTLEKIVRDALELAELRCVDGDSLRGLGQLLPALLFPSNPRGDTVEMPVDRLVASTTLDPR